MKWYLVYYWVHGERYDFACVRATYRRGAYLTVAMMMGEAISLCHGRYVRWTWDTEELMDDDTLRIAEEVKTLDEYQVTAAGTAVYPGCGEGQLIYPAIALVEEGGELAGKVMSVFQKQLMETGQFDGPHMLAMSVLGTAAAFGEVMGLMKKAYRNEPQGELTKERVSDIGKACTKALRALDELSQLVHSQTNVEFPTLVIRPEDRLGISSEAGDVLWYIAAFCREAFMELGQVGYENIAKLLDRKKRGTIASSGDNR